MNWTPLHFAADNGHLNIVEYLVNNHADIEATNNSVIYLCFIELLFI